MTAISSLPVEVWQAILRYAVEVPYFLDPDAYEGVLSSSRFPLNDECAYWYTEKTRNRMQLVSKSWDSFLRPYEHRFIRMLDIRHGKVAPEKLETAIRVSFGDYNCTCVGLCSNSSFFDFIIDALKQVGSMGAIVDMAKMPLFLWRLDPRLLENIKILVSTPYSHKYRLDGLLRVLPSLRHFHGTNYYGIEGRGLVLSNLVTSAFSIWPNQEYDSILFDFPCLRHLRVDSLERTATVEFTKGAVLNILRVVGSQLLSLYLYHVPPGNETLEEVWELCPKMENFFTKFSLVSPPLSHPIHTLYLHSVEQMEGLDPLPEWPNLRTIGFRCKWSEVDVQRRDTLVPSRELRVEDHEGLTLGEYKVRLKES